ncbi:MAG: hypothetical protein K8S62_01005 [Candidatus Sabulitectum sp.]|nr:hypothetical protein [Candidatus Sabulitectum sp.]
MKSHGKRFLLIGAIGVILFSVAQLIVRNFYIMASVELAVACVKNDSLHSTRQALISRIAVLEAPRRLREIGLELELIPLPLESFVLLEVSE